MSGIAPDYRDLAILAGAGRYAPRGVAAGATAATRGHCRIAGHVWQAAVTAAAAPGRCSTANPGRPSDTSGTILAVPTSAAARTTTTAPAGEIVPRERAITRAAIAAL